LDDLAFMMNLEKGFEGSGGLQWSQLWMAAVTSDERGKKERKRRVVMY